ncbi:MAG: S-layer homology domain-containing protein [Clostridia bacterium]|nr:S-layer homology domain-containing protein [Clostridia bacterium]
MYWETGYIYWSENHFADFVIVYDPADTEPEGIVNGYEDSTFRHANDVTREQVMAILHPYAAYKGLDSGMLFPMIPQYNYSLWAENDIIWADMVGLTGEIGADKPY